MDSAITFSTYHQNWPSPKAFGWLLKMWSSVPHPWHNEHDGTPTFLQQKRFTGQKIVSQLNEEFGAKRVSHNSDHEVLWSSAGCHLVHAPCCRWTEDGNSRLPWNMQAGHRTSGLAAVWLGSSLSAPLQIQPKKKAQKERSQRKTDELLFPGDGRLLPDPEKLCRRSHVRARCSN